jgi:hypothetical protein
MEQINGTYFVEYKSPKCSTERTQRQIQTRIFNFEGVCENFTTSGKCAFRNNNNEMLLVDYHDIIQLSPNNEN